MANIQPGKFHHQVQRGLKKISHCIIDLIVRNDGETSLTHVEEYTGLNNISNTITADILIWMMKDDLIKIENDIITGNVEKLTKILEQAKTRLPSNHGKPWSEDDYVRLAELKLAKEDDPIIAKKMDRTEKSVAMQSTMLHKAYRLIPIIQKYETVREFVREPVSPNPEK